MFLCYLNLFLTIAMYSFHQRRRWISECRWAWGDSWTLFPSAPTPYGRGDCPPRIGSGVPGGATVGAGRPAASGRAGANSTPVLKLRLASLEDRRSKCKMLLGENLGPVWSQQEVTEVALVAYVTWSREALHLCKCGDSLGHNQRLFISKEQRTGKSSHLTV